LDEGRRVKADGVFSGGGVKGLAFAGAVQAAAEAGYTEWGKLGTSAGAITGIKTFGDLEKRPGRKSCR
jgi:predicted acylesterase/phospholipase RssA